MSDALCPICKGDRQIREGEIDEAGTGPRFIRCPACSPTPPSSLDEPAVEAARWIIIHNTEPAMESGPLCESSIARIITDAYKAEQKRKDGRSAVVILQRKRIADLEHEVRAGRVVREKLVRMVGGMQCHCHDVITCEHDKCGRCRMLAEVEKLDA